MEKLMKKDKTEEKEFLYIQINDNYEVIAVYNSIDKNKPIYGYDLLDNKHNLKIGDIGYLVRITYEAWGGTFDENYTAYCNEVVCLTKEEAATISKLIYEDDKLYHESKYSRRYNEQYKPLYKSEQSYKQWQGYGDHLQNVSIIKFTVKDSSKIEEDIENIDYKEI